MLSIIKKELNTFFTSFTGYLIIIIFLLVNAWFLWIGKNSLNIIDGGFASLDGLFAMAPWLFLFLLPAITMRTIADEKKSGTIELLLAQPITERRLITGKYIAATIVAGLSLLPTLIYYLSIYRLGNPVGNIDAGGTWGSYIGLLLLAAGYAAIGVFASSLSDNQLVAFVVAATGCIFFYLGFDGLAALPYLQSADRFLVALGINEHYQSLSRGVIDWRDVLYFASLIVVFLEIATLKLKARKGKISTRRILRFAGLVAAIVLLNGVAHFFFFRIDMTADKRYSLTDASRQTMQQLNGDVQVYVFLDGDMSIQMKKLRSTIKETLDELKIHAGRRLRYDFVNLAEETDPNNLHQTYLSLRNRGLIPITEEEVKSDGSSAERTLFPGAIIMYHAPEPVADTAAVPRETAVNFLQDNAAANSDESLLTAQQNVEIVLTGAIARLTQTQWPHIAFVEGHGELDEYETGDICRQLASFARLHRVTLNGETGALNEYDAVIVAKPTTAWNDADKLVLDQYIMSGGRVAWFIDAVEVHHDSLANGHLTFALECNHQLNDVLFKYGVRINPDIISDLQCAYLPVNIAPAGQAGDFKPAPWVYHPLLIPPAGNRITQGLNLIEAKYPSSIDTVRGSHQVSKKIILHSSQYSRTQTIPAQVSLSMITQSPDPAAYQQPFLPVAVGLEGIFQSAFVHRPLQQYNNRQPFDFKPQGVSTKMIVVADGDIIRNDVTRRADGTRIFPLGFDRYMNVQFGNRNFVENCIYYLLDDGNKLDIRSREWTMRLLDRAKIYPQRTFWTAVNTVLPVFFTLLVGILFIAWHRRKYGR